VCAFFGGVPASILYNNSKLAVARILSDGTRQPTHVFSELQSQYTAPSYTLFAREPENRLPSRP